MVTDSQISSFIAQKGNILTKRLDFIRKLKVERGEHNCLDLKTAKNRYFDHGFGCNVQEGVLIGMDGFGYELDENTGKYVKFPHYGKVILGSYVDIFAPTVVCRGSVGNTIIGSGTKIAGNCQIGHNSQMGENCLIGPYVCVGGSTVIGDNVRIGQFVYIAHGVKIGNNVDISTSSHVFVDVPDDTKVKGVWK